MNAEEFEQAYELVAQALDRAGEAQQRLLLARAVLALAHRMPDLESFRQALAEAAAGLDGQEGQVP